MNDEPKGCRRNGQGIFRLLLLEVLRETTKYMGRTWDIQNHNAHVRKFKHVSKTAGSAVQ
jgi:hypothetical protein